MDTSKHNNLIAISYNTSWYVYNFRMPLIEALMDKDFRVGVIASVDEYSEKLLELGCEFYPINIRNKNTNPVTELPTIYDYHRIYSRLKPTAVLQYTAKPNIYGSMAARVLNIPCVNNITGLGTAFIKGGLLTGIVKALYRISQGSVYRIFFQNKDDMEIFINAKIARINQVDLLPGSGVELKKYQPAIKPESGHVRFILISRLIWDKGVGEYAEAARIVKKKYPQSEFQLVGYVDLGNPHAVKEEEIRSWEREKIVQWAGRQEDVRPFIADADCVVLPSYYREGTPRTLLEGASMAKPIIAADSIGTREPVDDGVNGFLCRSRDPQDLAEKMMQIIEMGHDRRVRMGRRGRLKMENEYDADIVVNKYLSVIDQIVKRQ